MNYWLVKSEPEAFSWDHLVRDGKTEWTGVRNFAARNFLKAMKKDDLVMFYHSVTGKEIVGIAKVSEEQYPDPSAETSEWVAVDIVPDQPLKNPVKLSNIKGDPRLKEFPLVRIGRLSVMPVSKEEWKILMQMSEKA